MKSLALFVSVLVLSACGTTATTQEKGQARENAHCVKNEIRPIYMSACVPNDETACADTQEMQVGNKVVCLAFECNDGYHRDKTGNNCIPDLEGRPSE
jgi:protein involved in sex pheromone biosynthesis